MSFSDQNCMSTSFILLPNEERIDRMLRIWAPSRTGACLPDRLQSQKQKYSYVIRNNNILIYAERLDAGT
jgi:hypothetical protein